MKLSPSDNSIFVAAGPQVLDSVLKLLDVSKRLTVAGTACNGQECLKRLAQTGAKIAFIDFSLPQISGVKVIEYISSRYPDIVSVLISDELNPEYFRSGMLAGAREFIVMPVTLEEMEFVVERVVQVAGASKRSGLTAANMAVQRRSDGRVIVCGSGKGGVGLSFVAANVAKLMAEGDSTIKIALIDLDWRANDLASIVNIEPQKTIKDLVPVISELDPVLIKSVAQHVTGNFDLFPSPPFAEISELFDADHLRLLVDALKDSYDIVIIDNGVFVDAAGAELFGVADLILVVLTPEILAVRGTKRFIDCLERFGISKNNMVALINRSGSFQLTPERISEYVGVSITEKLPESEIVRSLLDEGRLIKAGDRTEIKIAVDRLISTIYGKLSLEEAARVN